MKKAVSITICAVILLTALSSCRSVTPSVIVGEKNVDTDGFISLGPGVSKEMTDASYWIKDGYTDALFTDAQIDAFNEANSKLLGSKSSGSFTLQSIKDTISGVTVREILATMDKSEKYNGYYVNGTKVGTEYCLALENNISADTIPEKVNVKFGFSVVRGTMRRFPTRDYANDEENDLFYDAFIMSELLPFSPLAVLHESADGNWYYVASYACCGWVNREDMAICPSRSDWLERQNPENFLIVTGRQLRLTDDPYCRELSGLVLPMGSKLPLIKSEDAPDSINRRYAYGCYVVKLPVRLADGSITDAYSLIPSGEDVNVGYLQATRANIISQAFKLQGDIYGWAGDFHSNDCSGIIREIFRCFGMEFPRVGSQQVNVTGMPTIDISEKNEKEKLEAVRKLPAGSLLYLQGHIMIYLGTDSDDEPYVLSSVGSISSTDLPQGEVLQVNTVLVSSLVRTVRKTGVSWLNSLTTLLEMKAE